LGSYYLGLCQPRYDHKLGYHVRTYEYAVQATRHTHQVGWRCSSENVSVGSMAQNSNWLNRTAIKRMGCCRCHEYGRTPPRRLQQLQRRFGETALSPCSGIYNIYGTKYYWEIITEYSSCAYRRWHTCFLTKICYWRPIAFSSSFVCFCFFQQRRSRHYHDRSTSHVYSIRPRVVTLESGMRVKIGQKTRIERMFKDSTEIKIQRSYNNTYHKERARQSY